MSLLALITALLLEQIKPRWGHRQLHGWFDAYANYFQHHFNSGVYSHGKTAWWLAVLPMLAASVLLFRGLNYLHPLLAWAFNALVLYLGMGFRQFSQGFTGIQQALSGGHRDQARELLSALRGRMSDELSTDEIARVTIEVALTGALRHLFGVIVWFVLFALMGAGGAAGVLLYGLSLALATHWLGELNEGESVDAKFDEFSRKMRARLEWLPIRLTAATFAVVGHFEDAVYCWRTQSMLWSDSEMGILLASAAGASGVRLGMPILQNNVILDRPELGVGDQRGESALRCAFQLVWRSALFMMVVLFMLSLASLLD